MNAPTPPSALFYSNDIMALGGLAELDRMGLRIPEDVSVSGFDGLTLADFFRPRLTTICCDYVALGRDAADLLFSRLEHPDAPAINRLRPAYLRTTESIAPPSKRSPTAGA
jgi:DNA-binding LacI/PurR family transcriptional regulator